VHIKLYDEPIDWVLEVNRDDPALWFNHISFSEYLELGAAPLSRAR